MELILEKLTLAEWEVNKSRFNGLKADRNRLLDKCGELVFEMAGYKHKIKQLELELKESKGLIELLSKESDARLIEITELKNDLKLLQVETPILDKFLDNVQEQQWSDFYVDENAEPKSKLEIFTQKA